MSWGWGYSKQRFDQQWNDCREGKSNCLPDQCDIIIGECVCVRERVLCRTRGERDIDKNVEMKEVLKNEIRSGNADCPKGRIAGAEKVSRFGGGDLVRIMPGRWRRENRLVRWCRRRGSQPKFTCNVEFAIDRMDMGEGRTSGLDNFLLQVPTESTSIGVKARCRILCEY